MEKQKRVWFERILCPIDFELDSDEGLRYAVALARVYRSELYVCHCMKLGDFAESRHRAAAESMLDKAVRARVHAPGKAALDWSSVITSGDPSVEIVRECGERRVDLVVIRSRRRPMGRLLGSTAKSLSRSVPCPILVTGPDEREWASLTTNEIDLQRILIAYDFSTLSRQALLIGLSLGQEFQAELHLMHVLPAGTIRSAARDADYDSDIQHLAERLSAAVPAETGLWCEVKEVLREGDPTREIVSYAAANSIDLICVGASAEDVLINRVLGSTADYVLRNAACPVLIARGER